MFRTTGKHARPTLFDRMVRKAQVFVDEMRWALTVEVA